MKQDQISEEAFDIDAIQALPAYDPADYLQSDEALAAFLNDFLADGDAAMIAQALGIVARAKGMSEVAGKAGIARESLYKALRPESQPRLDTVLKVMRALGIELLARPITRTNTMAPE